MTVRVAINGFGRIGRAVMRLIAQREDTPLEVVAINDLTSPDVLAHLLKYDSVHGKMEGVHLDGDVLKVGRHEARIFSIRNPEELPWADLDVDIVFESTGIFREKEKAEMHRSAGAKKVIITAPAKGDVPTFVLGVNHEDYNPEEHHVVSNASCTTNCLAPIVKVLHMNFGVTKGLMTTIHSYTNDQRILDLPHRDLRRSRAAAMSMIPTTTGAAKAIALVIPELKGKIDGLAVRVPTPNVSLVDFVAEVERDVTVQEVNDAIRKAASEGPLKGILGYTDEPLVSVDFNGSHFSSTADLGATAVAEGRLVKVLSWYDNEMGYSSRLVDLAEMIAENL